MRDEARARARLGSEVHLVPATAEALEACVPTVRAVVNLAGAPIFTRWTDAARERIVSSRLDTTRSIVRAMELADTPPAVLVSASAIGWYDASVPEVQDERAPAAGGFVGELVREWEHTASEAEASGVRVVLARIGLVVGPGGGMLGNMLPAFRAGLGGRIGSGRQAMPWVHLDDVVEVLVQALTDARYAGPINLVAPDPERTQQSFAEALGGVLGRPTVVPAPAFAIRLVMGDAAELLLVSPRVAPRRLEALGYTFRYRSLVPALEAATRPRPR